MTVRDRVRALLDETDLCDPHAITDVLLGELKGAKVREALAELLPGYVRVVINSERNGFTPYGDEDVDRPDPAKVQPTAHTRGAGSSRSTKWASARSLFRRRIQVDHDYLFLGDLTVDQVGWLVDDRYRKAKDLTSKGDRYAALRDLMVRRGVTRVRDLPEEEVAEILS